MTQPARLRGFSSFFFFLSFFFFFFFLEDSDQVHAGSLQVGVQDLSAFATFDEDLLIPIVDGGSPKLFSFSSLPDHF